MGADVHIDDLGQFTAVAETWDPTTHDLDSEEMIPAGSRCSSTSDSTASGDSPSPQACRADCDSRLGTVSQDDFRWEPTFVIAGHAPHNGRVDELTWQLVESLFGGGSCPEVSRGPVATVVEKEHFSNGSTLRTRVWHDFEMELFEVDVPCGDGDTPSSMGLPRLRG